MLTFFVHMVWGSVPIARPERTQSINQIMAIIDGRICYFHNLLDAGISGTLRDFLGVTSLAPKESETMTLFAIPTIAAYQTLRSIFLKFGSMENLNDVYFYLVKHISSDFQNCQSELLYFNKIKKILCQAGVVDYSEAQESLEFTEGQPSLTLSDIAIKIKKKMKQLSEKIGLSTNDFNKKFEKLNKTIPHIFKKKLDEIKGNHAQFIAYMRSIEQPNQPRQMGLNQLHLFCGFAVLRQSNTPRENLQTHIKKFTTLVKKAEKTEKDFTEAAILKKLLLEKNIISLTTRSYNFLLRCITNRDIYFFQIALQKIKTYQKQLDQVEKEWEKVKRFLGLIEKERRQKLLRIQDKEFIALKNILISETSEIQDSLTQGEFRKLVHSETDDRDQLGQEFEESLDKIYLEDFLPSLWQSYEQTKKKDQYPQSVEEDVLPACEPKINFFQGTELSGLINRLKKGASVSQSDIIRALEAFGYLHRKQGSECTYQIWDSSGNTHLAFIHLRHGDDTVWTAKDWRYKAITDVLQRAGFLKTTV